MNTIVMLSLISSLWGKAFSFSPDMEGLGPEKFAHHFLTRKVYSVMIDARPAEAFAQGNLSKSINVPFSETFLQEVDKALEDKDCPKSLLLFVYAGDAGTTEELLAYLEREKQSKAKIKHKVQLLNYLEGGYQGLEGKK